MQFGFLRCSGLLARQRQLAKPKIQQIGVMEARRALNPQALDRNQHLPPYKRKCAPVRWEHGRTGGGGAADKKGI